MINDRAARRALAYLEQGHTIAVAAAHTGLTPATIRRLGAAVGLVEHADGTMRYTPPAGSQGGRAQGGRTRDASATYPSAEVRAWARERGIPVPTRGRYLPDHVVAAWRQAHR